MKTTTWDNPNKMHFESPHKTFNRQVDCISTGNIIGNVQYSNYIRSYNETKCNGFVNPLGHLQNYDLTKNVVANTLPNYIREQVRKLTHNDGGIIYNFHHWHGDKRLDDGFVLTTRKPYKQQKLIRTWYVNNDWRAMGAVDEAIKYITN